MSAISLASIVSAMDEIETKFPTKLASYYRCNESTYKSLLLHCNVHSGEVEKFVLNGVTIIIDDSVPSGKFWDPDGIKLL